MVKKGHKFEVVQVRIKQRNDYHDVGCDIPCRWTHGGNIMTRAKIVDFEFEGKSTLLMSMEGPKHYPELKNKANNVF